MKTSTYVSMFATLILFSGCNEMGGADQVVLPASTVTLHAINRDFVKSIKWEQTSGPKVELSSYTIANPTFIAPDLNTTQYISFEMSIQYKDDVSFNGSLFDTWFPDMVEIIVKDNDPIFKTAQKVSKIDGDDGFYQKGVDRNYTRDDSNGIVYDNVHHLIWQDNIVVQRAYESNETGFIDQYYNETANEYCINLSLGSIDTWRVPEERELRSLVNYAQQETAIDSIFKFTKAGDYLALQTEETSVYGWLTLTHSDPKSINFTDGIESNVDVYKKINVRCVSGEKMYKSSFSRDNNQSLVYDKTNKLTWLDNEKLSGTLSEAIEYCENLEYAGFNNWRMANISELITTLDYTLPVYDLTNAAFGIGNFGYMMSSTSDVHDESKVWAIDFKHNNTAITTVIASDKNNYRCIRENK